MSSMLNQKCALTKLRAELKERSGKLCYEYKQFRHLVHNCRNKREKGKRTLKEAKGTISLTQAKDAVLGSNCMLKSLWR